MAMDKTLQAACDTFIDKLLPQLQASQEAYASEMVDAGLDGDGKPQQLPRGKSLQLLATPVNIPTKTVKRAPDLALKAEGHDAAWADLGLDLDATLPCQMRVDAYDGDAGIGAILMVMVTESGALWQRVVSITGPELWRERPWTQVNN